MAGKTFDVEIVTPGETALAAKATALQAPAWEGYLGVLAGHAPMLVVLKPGVLTVRDEAGKARFFAIKGGFMEVTQARVIVLADDVERAEEIDEAAAQKAFDAAAPGAAGAPAAAAEGATMEARRIAREVAAEEREESRKWA